MVAIERDARDMAEASVERGAAVSEPPSLSGARDGLDHPVGADPTDAEALAVRDVEDAVGVDREAVRLVQLRLGRRAPVSPFADLVR